MTSLKREVITGFSLHGCVLRLVEWGELLVHVYMTVLHYLVNGDDTCLCVYMFDVISLFGAQ